MAVIVISEMATLGGFGMPTGLTTSLMLMAGTILTMAMVIWSE